MQSHKSIKLFFRFLLDKIPHIVIRSIIEGGLGNAGVIELDAAIDSSLILKPPAGRLLNEFPWFRWRDNTGTLYLTDFREVLFEGLVA